MSAAPTIAVYPDDLGGCGHYRLIWPARALAAQGAPIDVRPHTEPNGIFLDTFDGTVLYDVVAPDADIAVIQRPLKADMVTAVRKLQDHGVKVVVDIDDDFAALHPKNISWRHVHPKASPKRNHHHLMQACAAADWVTCTTPALAARYGKHGRVTVVPNYVPARYLEVERQPHDGLVVGWTGTVQTHPTDLQVTGGAVARACRAEGAGIGVVGTGIGVGRNLDFSRDDVHGTGWLDLDDYPAAMAAFDVGIVPLDDIAFNQAKSALKLAEFTALGVPTVASPTADNVRLAKLGAGVLAARPREWERELRRLLSDDDHRQAVAARGRQAMAGQTIEGNCGRWLDAWSNALTTTRRRAAS
jgi:glycosyltransferase involved in cell wall biosynthesis